MEKDTLDKLATALDDAGYRIHKVKEERNLHLTDHYDVYHKTGDIKLRISPKEKPEYETAKYPPPNGESPNKEIAQAILEHTQAKTLADMTAVSAAAGAALAKLKEAAARAEANQQAELATKTKPPSPERAEAENP